MRGNLDCPLLFLLSLLLCLSGCPGPSSNEGRQTPEGDPQPAMTPSPPEDAATQVLAQLGNSHLRLSKASERLRQEIEKFEVERGELRGEIQGLCKSLGLNIREDLKRIRSEARFSPLSDKIDEYKHLVRKIEVLDTRYGKADELLARVARQERELKRDARTAAALSEAGAFTGAEKAAAAAEAWHEELAGSLEAQIRESEHPVDLARELSE
jgi:hypothetical protein